MIAIQKAMDKMKEKGLKCTDKREEILDLLARESRYLSAKEVQEILQETFPSISQDTIYRNLNLFSELDILETTELNGEKLYQFSCMSKEHHHHHFICTCCGKTTALEMCPLDFFENQLPGCRISSHRFDIFGECEKCIKNTSNAES